MAKPMAVVAATTMRRSRPRGRIALRRSAGMAAARRPTQSEIACACAKPSTEALSGVSASKAMSQVMAARAARVTGHVVFSSWKTGLNAAYSAQKAKRPGVSDRLNRAKSPRKAWGTSSASKVGCITA